MQPPIADPSQPAPQAPSAPPRPGQLAPYPPGPAGYQYAGPPPARPSNRGCWIAAAVVGGVLALFLLLVGGCSVYAAVQANRTSTVEVIISGVEVTDGWANINPPGGAPTEQIKPWEGSTETRTYPIRRYGFVSVYAYSSAAGRLATVKCEIKVDGRSVAHDWGAVQGSAHCSYTHA